MLATVTSTELPRRNLPKDRDTVLYSPGTGADTVWMVGNRPTSHSSEEETSGTITICQSNQMAASVDKTVRLWDVQTGQSKVVMVGHTGEVDSAVFSADGTLLASRSTDGTVRLWYVLTGQVKAVLSGHTNGVTGLLFSPDGAAAGLQKR